MEFSIGIRGLKPSNDLEIGGIGIRMIHALIINK